MKGKNAKPVQPSCLFLNARTLFPFSLDLLVSRASGNRAECNVVLRHNLTECPLIRAGDRARTEIGDESGSFTNPSLQSGHLDQQEVRLQVPRNAHLLSRQHVHLTPRGNRGELRKHEELPYGLMHGVLNY